MINGKTFYQILGVLNVAEDLVIRAAYRSLSNKYHPDKWMGDKKFAHERMSEINAAYDCLGDPAKRREYDEELERQGRYDDATDIDNDTSDFEQVYSEHSDAWDIALRFFPDLSSLHERLKKINSSLAYTFKTTLIEKKDFAAAQKLAEMMERKFLEKYFGTDESTQNLAKFLIVKDARPAARELNRMVSVMGGSISEEKLRQVLKKQFPNAFKVHRASSEDFLELLDLARIGKLSAKNMVTLIKSVSIQDIEVKVEPHWWYYQTYSFTWVDGSMQRLNGVAELSSFIRSHVLPLYTL